MTEKPKFTGQEVVETDKFVLFWKPPAIFGQWTPSKFVIDGQEYCNAEQFMMAEKARLFSDDAILEKILATTSPRSQKRLGRKIAGFNDAIWLAARIDIVVRGNYAKFTQNSELEHILLATGDKILAEASPYDKIWGIGLRGDNAAALIQSKWRGENLLGKALMTVRNKIRVEKCG